MHVEIGEGIRSILIVEDEGLVAMLMEDLVRDMGVREVHMCSDVKSALQLARTADIDCAVLDVWVRDGHTSDVADALAARNVPFIFSTGSSAESLDERHRDRPIITKPFADEDFKLILLDTITLARSGLHGPMAERRLRVAPHVATD